MITFTTETADPTITCTDGVEGLVLNCPHEVFVLLDPDSPDYIVCERCGRPATLAKAWQRVL